ncbi:MULTISPECIES: hypothetical protein [Shewanella]|uniref:hypothetical protein n=1 Tax=Shewanella TaxID=22 RepID=UPI0030076EF3
MDYVKNLNIRLALWWLWWVILLLCVLGWITDILTGMHPLPELTIPLIAISIVILFNKFPSIERIIDKDLNGKNPERRNNARLYMLDRKVSESEKADALREKIKDLEEKVEAINKKEENK